MSRRPALILTGALLAGPGFACSYPDEGTMPLRRAVTKVKLLPQTEAWANRVHKAGGVVQYALLLEQQAIMNGRCYWTVEARGEGKVWRRFLVTPDGRSILTVSGETADPPAS